MIRRVKKQEPTDPQEADSIHRAIPIAGDMTDAILESISDGVFTVDSEWRVTSFNRSAEEITGIPRAEAIGRRCSDVFRSSMCEVECALRRTMKNGQRVVCQAGYIIDADGVRIPVSISTALLKDASGRVIGGAETFRDLSEVEALRRELEGRFCVGDLTSRSPIMQKLFEALPVIAASASTVLILGETGTGKELVARTLHELSSRAKGPFVAVNCGALPDTLLESELFGYMAGAFTGATRNKPGRFALARKGTLFLDEIGEITPALQIRLLRVLQERAFEPLGSTRSETTDARIVVATNRDLSELMRAGTFREDLYYRVNVVRIELPPLRRRKEDIPLLVDQFIERFNCQQDKAIPGMTSAALSLLMAHDWPGNIRELQNVVERAFVLCPEGQLGIEHLPPEMTARRPAESVGGVSRFAGPGSTSIFFPESTGQERSMRTAHDFSDAQAIRVALERNGYNRLAAARELGVHKTTLFRKIKKLGLDLPTKDGRSQSDKQ